MARRGIHRSGHRPTPMKTATHRAKSRPTTTNCKPNLRKSHRSGKSRRSYLALAGFYRDAGALLIMAANLTAAARPQGAKPMPDDHGVVREIAWREIFPWLGIVRSARLALAPRLILLAALGCLSPPLVGERSAAIFSGSEECVNPGPASKWAGSCTTGAGPANPTVASGRCGGGGDLRPLDTPLVATWDWISTPFARLFSPDIGLRSAFSMP